MKRISAVVLAAFLCSTVLICAQAPPAPTPPPELKRLGYFVGDWTTEADMKPSPYGAGGKFTGKDHIEWMSGNFFIVSHSSFEGAMGSGNQLYVMGYKTDEKVYTYDSFSSMGQADHSTGTVEGDTWTWTSEQKMGGKLIKGRFIIKELSPTSYAFKYDVQPEGAEWASVMEGKATKKK